MTNKILYIIINTIQIVLTSTADNFRQDRLKILNWNVLYGFNHKKSIKKGANWIKSQTPNVVALQELNGNNAESLSKLAAKWNHEHSVILKHKGFPVGLTSQEPIEIIERRVKGFHHGYLHCKTYGINFFVVHFWPGKDHEAKTILAKIQPLLNKGEKVVVLGDFNTYSPKDKAFLSGVGKNKKDLYAVVDMFEKAGFVDLVHKHDKKAKYSCPSPIIIPRWAKNLKEIELKRERIDFIFADKKLQKSSISATIMVSKLLDQVSDHYPVTAEFKLNMNRPTKN